nr:hypothetical protein CFP56_57012 [Quercus suber]
MTNDAWSASPRRTELAVASQLARLSLGDDVILAARAPVRGDEGGWGGCSRQAAIPNINPAHVEALWLVRAGHVSHGCPRIRDRNSSQCHPLHPPHPLPRHVRRQHVRLHFRHVWFSLMCCMTNSVIISAHSDLVATRQATV